MIAKMLYDVRRPMPSRLSRSPGEGTLPSNHLQVSVLADPVERGDAETDQVGKLLEDQAEAAARAFIGDGKGPELVEMAVVGEAAPGAHRLVTLWWRSIIR